MQLHILRDKIREGAFAPLFAVLYGDASRAQQRYLSLLERFAALYPQRTEVRLFSASGRVEIGGNHTDHQHGRVLAAAVDADAVAAVAFHDEGVMRLYSEGYGAFEVDTADLSVQEGEGGPAALVRGIAARLGAPGGFDLYCTSEVPVGSGLSSSAAFETLIGTVINAVRGDAAPLDIAKAGQFAENVYFGKKNGLMDPTVSAVGGLVGIDFADIENPVIERIAFDFEQNGYALCITETGGSHEGLDGEYHAVRSEMERVAAHFGADYLRAVDKEAFYRSIPAVRAACGDRAVLRAAHFFAEDERAALQVQAVKAGDMPRFLELVRQSGASSAFLLQNIYPSGAAQRQEMALAIHCAEQVLGGHGAVRVHGGGFAGTVLALVPCGQADGYIEEMEKVFGRGSCRRLRVRSIGALEVTV